MPAAQAMESQVIDQNDYETARLGVKSLLKMAGRIDDPGVLDTPARVIKAFREMTKGIWNNPETILSKLFECKTDELIIVNGIDFVSLCEHHLLPFTGTATVGYIPTGKVVGLSKIPRLVECFAHRLQLQEQLTEQIANAMYSHPELKPKGVGCIIEATHACMSCRGVRKAGARMITSAMLGEFRDNPTLRGEFLNLRK